VDGGCTHCGLPLGRSPVRGTVAGEPGRFCCVGCLLAMQVTRARGDAGAAGSLLVRLGIAVFFAMNVMMTSMSSWVPHVYGGSSEALDGPLFALLRVLAACFALPVLAILGGPIAAAACAALRRGRAGSDLLVMLAVLAAYGLSLRNLVAGRSEVYFDTAVMLLVFVTAGRWLEARARAEAGRAIRTVLSPQPATARRVVASGIGVGGIEEVPLAALLPGDVVEVAPGAAFPTDGIVVDGEALVDESALTGESRPVAKGAGSEVAGGTCSIDGRLRVRATAPAAASAAARIAALIDGARRERSPAERLADAVAAALVPVVLAIALGAGVWWTARAGVEVGVLVAVSVLVVACPCALGIATPVVVAAGLARAARRGVVVRSASVLERAAQAARVVFDKTGTLTEPVPHLVELRLEAGAGIDARALLAAVAGLELGLAHPLARAVLAAAHERDVVPRPASEVRVVPGRGVRGVVDGRDLFVGRVAAAAHDTAAAPAPAGVVDAGSLAVVTCGARRLALLRFVERARRDAAEAVQGLATLGVPVTVLSGDHAVGAIVPEVVAARDVVSNLDPAGKLRELRALRAALPSSRDAVLMVGDGINDAPALAAADLGIAVAGATDLARLTADVVVLGGGPGAVVWLVAHARRVRRVARQNLAWAFGYNAVAVVLAATGALTPLLAALAMLTSSLAVLANARRVGAGAAASEAWVPQEATAETPDATCDPGTAGWQPQAWRSPGPA